MLILKCTRACRTYCERKKNIYFYVHKNIIINSQFFKYLKKGLILQTTGGLHSYTQQVESNSQLLVFYREKRHIALYGNATTWNSTGFDEIYQPSCKLRLNIFT